MDMTDNKSFKWCGYTWTNEMEGGRLINLETPWCWYSLDTISVCQDDVLELSIRYNPKEITYWDGKTYNPTLEVSNMRSLEDFGYGEFSADVMLPNGSNLWPSFWLSGSKNWPPEIDILEAWGDDNGYFRWTVPYFPYLLPSWKTTTNIHYNGKDLLHRSVGSKNVSFLKQPKDPAENWLTYKCRWEPSKITFYIGGREIRRIDGDVPRELTTNLTNPMLGFKMNAIFNVWCEDPSKHSVSLRTPMKIKNFTYKPL